MDEERPPICPACGVTMVPAALSARERPAGEWICLECEETDELDPTSGSDTALLLGPDGDNVEAVNHNRPG